MIIVSLVTIFLIIWVVSSFTNMSIGKRLSEQIKQQLVYKETDYMKGFSRVALIFSSHNALRDTGKLGGVTEISMERNWICTDPKVPSTDQVRYHLSKETLKYLNKYISNVNNANQRDILQYKVSKFSCVDYDVSQSGVDSGTNDVSYNIGAYSSDIEVKGEDGTASSDNDVYEEISPVRYWLMYRKFSEWAKRNVLKKEVADCLPKICDCPANTNGGCGNVNNCPIFKSCVAIAVEKAKADLKNGFADSRIECRSSLMCDYTEWEECKGSDSLEVWKNAPKCNRCVLGETGPLCGKSINLDDGYTKSISANLIQEKSEKINAADRGPDQCTGKVCKYYRETRGAMEATFTCIDKKHLLSTKEHNELQFTVYATIDLKKKNCPENSAIMTIDDCIWSCTKWSDTDCEDVEDPGPADDRDSSGKCKSYVCIYEECLDCDCKRPYASGARTLTSMPRPDTGCRWCVKEPGTPIPKTTTTSTIPPTPSGGACWRINMPTDCTTGYGTTYTLTADDITINQASCRKEDREARGVYDIGTYYVCCPSEDSKNNYYAVKSAVCGNSPEITPGCEAKDGVLFCWGNNYRLGDSDSMFPEPAPGSDNRNVYLGWPHSDCFMYNGKQYCMADYSDVAGIYFCDSNLMFCGN